MRNYATALRTGRLKKKYDKPSIGSEQVFKLTSQACGVNEASPGVCADGFRYQEFCDSPYKIRNAECPELIWPPVPYS